MTCFMKGIALAVLVTAVAALGQGFDPKATLVIPHDFVTQGKVMPAGKYTISTPTLNTVMLRNVRTNETVMPFCHFINQFPPLDETKLRFRKDGDIMVLHQVVLRDHNYALDVIHGPEIPELILAKR
jgi:hypothetical protein